MPKNIPMTAELFGKMLDRLIEMVVLGRAHITIGRGLGRALNEDQAIAHVAPVFWGMTLTAHLDIAQLIAFKLFDPRNGTMTIEFLLNHAEKIKALFGKATPDQVSWVVKTARTQAASLDDSLKQIRAKRNRVLAHVDPTIVTDPERLTKEVELTFSDLNLVFNIAGSILNEVSVAFRDASPLYEMIGTEDFESVIDLVADAKCAQVREYEKEFGSWLHLRPKKCQ